MLKRRPEPKYRYQYRSIRGSWKYFFRSTDHTLYEYGGRMKAINIPSANTRPNSRFLKFTNHSGVIVARIKPGILKIRRAKATPPFKIRWIIQEFYAGEEYLLKSRFKPLTYSV